MIWYCYEIRNLINGKYYRGKSGAEDPEKDVDYLGSGPLIKRAISKYGKKNFKKTILATFETEEEAYAYESKIVTAKEVKDPDCYNIIQGGRGGATGVVYMFKGSVCTKVDPLLVEQYLEQGWQKGVPEYICKKHSEHYNPVSAEKHRGHHHTEEWKAQHSAQLKGKPNLKNRGRVLSEEARQHISEGHKGLRKGQPVAEEVKARISATLKQRALEHPRVKVNNGIIGKLIELDQLEEYLQNGWVRGRLPMTEETKAKAHYGESRIGTHHSEETKAKMRAAREGKPGYTKGKTPVNNGEISKYVLPEELDSYLQQGWQRGRLFKQTKTIYKNQTEE